MLMGQGFVLPRGIQTLRIHGVRFDSETARLVHCLPCEFHITGDDDG